MSEFQERIEKVRAALAEGEGALISGIPNRFYLTGFNSSDGEVLITHRGAYFFIDFRYVEKARSVVRDMTVILYERGGQILEQMKADGVRRLLVEADVTSLSTYERYEKAFDGVEIAREDTVDRVLRRSRSIKTPAELSHIRAAQKLTDDTFTYILGRIEPGRTERDVMLDMEFYMRRMGSEGVSFDFIVVSGKNSSLPHGVPTDKKIERGDFLTMDFGAIVDGYHSDMTRTVAVGAVDDEQRRVYETVAAAQNASFAVIRPGTICRDVDAAARDLIDGAGYAGCFGHGLGHSVGIEIHEMPACNRRDETPLEPGMIMTVEPGIYIENRYGVRIEDMVVVTENGYENLTHSEKKLLIV